MAEEYYARIRYFDEETAGGTPLAKQESFYGEDASYGFSLPDEPPYAKIYQGNRTFIVPIQRVICIESVSKRKNKTAL